MMNRDELAKRLQGYKEAGLDIGQGCVVAEGVFFSLRESAEIAAKKYDRELVEIKGPVSGWLMKDPAQSN